MDNYDMNNPAGSDPTRVGPQRSNIANQRDPLADSKTTNPTGSSAERPATVSSRRLSSHHQPGAVGGVRYQPTRRSASHTGHTGATRTDGNVGRIRSAAAEVDGIKDFPHGGINTAVDDSFVDGDGPVKTNGITHDGAVKTNGIIHNGDTDTRFFGFDSI